MAMNCREFLDNVTQVGVTQVGASQAAVLLHEDAAAHLSECPDCQAWHAAAQPALALFATASCGNAGSTNSQRFADSIAVYVESDVAPPRSPSRLSRLLRERFKISTRSKLEEEATSTDTPAAVEPSQAGKEDLAHIDPPYIAPAEKTGKSANQRLSDALLRIAAGVVILLLVFSVLQRPQDAEVAGTTPPGQLLPIDATLDSLGLVAACVEPQQLDVHSALVADHLGDLACCTRCHQAASPASPHGTNKQNAAADTLNIAGAGHAVPKLSEAKRNLLAESCLLCHQG